MSGAEWKKETGTWGGLERARAYSVGFDWKAKECSLWTDDMLDLYFFLVSGPFLLDCLLGTWLLVLLLSRLDAGIYMYLVCMSDCDHTHTIPTLVSSSIRFLKDSIVLSDSETDQKEIEVR